MIRSGWVRTTASSEIATPARTGSVAEVLPAPAFPKPEPRAKKKARGLQRRRPKRLDRPDAAPSQLSWVHTQPCEVRRVESQPGYFYVKTKAQAGCGWGAEGRIEACHEGKKPGIGLKSSDTKAFAMCRKHHRAFTGQVGHQGHFEGWTMEQKRDWADRRGAETEARFLSAGSRRS